MHKLKLFLQAKPAFLFLLPLFFVLHGYVANWESVPAMDAIVLTGVYLLTAAVLTGLFFLLYRDLSKAALLVFFLLAYNFFFGSMHDFAKKVAGNTFFVKYSFILPASLLIFIILIIYLKKSKKNFGFIFQYINLVLLILIIVDIAGFIINADRQKKVYTQTARDSFIVTCDSCAKPDVYLIIADEYAGKKELADIFSYDNSSFENDLQSRGFHIVKDTKSNYNWTIYSVASLLGMDYVHNLKSQEINYRDMFGSADVIKANKVSVVFKGLGYKVYNCSIFDIDEAPKPVSPVFFPPRKSLITAQTFLHRVQRDLWFHYAPKEKIEKILKHNLYNNIAVDSLTKNIAATKTATPKFVYTHLVMPHYSYYFDSLGKERPLGELYDDFKADKKGYIEYLVYSNKKLLELIDHIQHASNRQSVIILMGDHGFRQFADSTDPKYYFMNLDAVYLPNHDYAGFYDGMSNVNQFRIILNTLFKQHIPLLKDSTSFFIEPESGIR